MRQATAAILLVAGLVPFTGIAAAQGQLPSRTLPGTAATDKSDALRERTGRPPDREIPQLQDRSGSTGSAPAAIRDRFESFCKSRGGCPGGYVQHQAEFAIYEQERRAEQRQELERNLQQRQQPNSGSD